MSKFLKDHSIALSLVFWRIGLFLIAFLALFIFPEFRDSFPYWNEELVATQLPSWIWGFGNFDGVHYLRIAKEGYLAQYSQAFFPLYPILISLFSFDPFGLGRAFSFFYSGIIISTLAFFTSIFFLYRLFLLDFDKETTIKSILLLISFPTAFYFGSIYTESLFLLFAVSFFYFLRKGNFLIAGLFAGLASSTRLIGVLLIIPLMVEVFWHIGEKKLILVQKVWGYF